MGRALFALAVGVALCVGVLWYVFGDARQSFPRLQTVLQQAARPDTTRVTLDTTRVATDSSTTRSASLAAVQPAPKSGQTAGMPGASTGSSGPQAVSSTPGTARSGQQATRQPGRGSNPAGTGLTSGRVSYRDMPVEEYQERTEILLERTTRNYDAILHRARKGDD